MLKFNDRPKLDNELVLYWTSPPSVRCVLVGTGDGVDLHLIRDAVVVRRTLNVDPRFAREIARQWHVEFELTRVRDGATDGAVCPECGDEQSSIYRGITGDQRRYCRACGNDWCERIEERA